MSDLSRRVFLQGAAVQLAPKSKDYFAYVGCYTTVARKGRGDGIHVYHIDSKSGVWSHVQRFGDVINPSFLITSRNGRFCYSVHGDEAYATAFSIDARSGELTLLNRAESGGKNGVHQAIDSTGRYMVVANYASATVAVLPIQADGRLQNYVQLVELRGEPGPLRAEQAGSHPHQVVFDPSGRFVAVPDKGLDRTFLFRFNSGKLIEHGSVAARPGSGPRHMAFHPKLPVAWILNELSSTVTTHNWDAVRGTLKPAQILTTLPEDFTGQNTCAEIVVSSDGRFLYCSNRGHDSIAMFTVDAGRGRLRSAGWVPSQGAIPRFMTFDPPQQKLYVANEQGDTIVTFLADDGKLIPTGQVIRNASPVTITFA